MIGSRLKASADKPQHEGARNREQSSVPDLWALLEQVADPEIPVVSIWDLGILHDISVSLGAVTVVITPTYSGCPAMQEISNDIKAILNTAGYKTVIVKSVLAPAWSTDWISPEGHQKLLKYGIAPPSPKGNVACPRCGSAQTLLVSEFGSTACKALYKCKSCLEPFDYFKCL